MTERTFRWLPVLISILVVVVTVAVAWGSLGARMTDSEEEIRDNDDRIAEVEQAIPQIQTDIRWIREALEEVNK